MSRWPKHDYRGLRQQQVQDAERVVLEDDHRRPLRTLAAFDAAYADRRGFGALVTAELHGPRGSDNESDVPADAPPTAATAPKVVVAEAEVTFPYVPGFLAYRESPMFDAVIEAAAREGDVPDIVIIDGSGLLHPSRFGQACHFGVRHDVPTIGVSKRLFVGEVQGDADAMAPGEALPIHWDDELCGFALRIGARSKKPVFVSPGHRCSPAGALAAVRQVASPAHRLPWPQQMAHEAAGAARRRALTG